MEEPKKGRCVGINPTSRENAMPERMNLSFIFETTMRAGHRMQHMPRRPLHTPEKPQREKLPGREIA
jgi:hypothetical protein